MAYCRPDPNHGTRGDYRIRSVYLDGPSLPLLRATLRGDADRFKLRARVYGDSPEVVHLEVKRKTGAFVRKARARLSVSEWSRRGAEAAVGPGATRFQSESARLVATPRAMVSYRRRAFQSVVDRYARVTFDREIAASRPGPAERAFEPAGPVLPLDANALGDRLRVGMVLLEVKCERRLPTWITRLIRDEGLEPRGFSKYGRAALALSRRQGFEPAWSIRYG